MNWLVPGGPEFFFPQKVSIATEKACPKDPLLLNLLGDQASRSVCRKASGQQEVSSNRGLWLLLRQKVKLPRGDTDARKEAWNRYWKHRPIGPVRCRVEEHGILIRVLGSKLGFDTHCVCSLSCFLYYILLCFGLIVFFPPEIHMLKPHPQYLII